MCNLLCALIPFILLNILSPLGNPHRDPAKRRGRIHIEREIERD